MGKRRLLTLMIGLLCTLCISAQNMVDLGLPSRTLWADRNLGATTEKGRGSLYQWGETTPQTNFAVDLYTDYRFFTNVSKAREDGEYVYNYTITKYTAEGATLEAADDAATAAWGSDWRMPTKTEWEELITQCTWKPNNDTEKTYTVTGPNGNSIIISFDGYRNDEGTAVPGLTSYWTNELSTEHLATTASIQSSNRRIGSMIRPACCPIRPVAVAKATTSADGNYTLLGDATLSVAQGANLDDVKTALGDKVSDITELYISGEYLNKAAVDALKTNYFPNLAKVHLTLVTASTSIANSAFEGCSSLTSINIPEAVRTIGYRAFADCSSLTSINIPEAVRTIGGSAFYGCSSLTSINIPEAVTSIGSSAFYGCNSLESMTLSFVGGSATATEASASTLFGYIFGYSSSADIYTVNQHYNGNFTNRYSIPYSLKKVTITGGELLGGVFEGCKSLTSISIDIPNSVTSIGNYAFYGCSSLTSINIPEAVTTIGNYAFYGCSSLTSINIPEAVTTIGNNAFYGCSGITEFVIPESVIAIGANGINTNSESLNTIKMLSATPPELADKNAIHTIPNIFIPSESFDAYAEATNWADHRGQFIPIGTKTEWSVTTTADDNMSSIHALIGEDNLDKVVNLKVKGTINSYDIMIMRNKMTHLKHIDLGEASIVANNYEYYTGYHSENDVLDRYAFRSDLASIILPQNLKTIGNNVFENFSIAEICIPKTVTTIGISAFQNCSFLKNLEFEDGIRLESLGNYCFDGCTNITGDLVVNAITIGDYCFRKCKSIAKVSLPITTKIGSWAFYDSTLDEISMPCVINIENFAFRDCKLQSISIPPTTLSIGNYVFDGNSLKSVYIEDGNETLKLGYGWSEGSGTVHFYYDMFSSNSIEYFYVGRNVSNSINNIVAGRCINSKVPFEVEFRNGTNIPIFTGSQVKKVIASNTVTSIPDNNFSGCKYLEEIYAPNVTIIGSSAFSGSNISQISFGNLQSIGSSAFSNCNNLQTINIGNQIISIGESAFSNCTNLKDIELPASLKTIGTNAFEKCRSLTSCTLPQNSVLSEIPSSAFSGCTSLEKMRLPVSVKKIGDYAFQNCSNMTEMKIPSSITSIGASAFAGCTKLNDVYTYTIEPQDINQNTFATYSTATVHVPAVSWYNYYYHTQWSQFLHLANFDEPYDYVLIQKDFTLRTETSGIISGKPETEIDATGGLLVVGNVEQPLGDVHVKFDVTTQKGSSIIAQNNLTADNLYVDIDVKKDFWHFFCFPFDVDLTKIKKDGSYIFRRYDSLMRAAGNVGCWRDVEGTTLAAGKGYIFRTNTAGVLSIPVANPNLSGNEKTTVLVKYGDDNTPDENKNWNFVGNTYLSYYDTNSMTYEAPIVVWDGTTYVAYRPGDDEYKLTPFQAFFVQSPNDVADVTFSPDGRMTGIATEKASSATSKSRMLKAARLNPDRLLINISISDGENKDNCRVVFNDNQELGYEMGCDAAKFLSTENVPQIYTIDDNGTQYAINERPMLAGQVNIGFVAPHDGEYTFATSRMDIPVYVIDNMTGETVNLAEGYTFTAEAGTDNTRFAITSKPQNVATAIKTISADVLNNGNAEIYDLSGKRVTKGIKGVYIVDGAKVYVK